MHWKGTLGGTGCTGGGSRGAGWVAGGRAMGAWRGGFPDCRGGLACGVAVARGAGASAKTALSAVAQFYWECVSAN